MTDGEVSKTMLTRCRAFLVSFLDEHGAAMPSKFEDKILGRYNPLDLVFFGRPRWFETPWRAALASLVEDGTVVFTQDAEGNSVYSLSSLNGAVIKPLDRISK